MASRADPRKGLPPTGRGFTPAAQMPAAQVSEDEPISEDSGSECADPIQGSKRVPTKRQSDLAAKAAAAAPLLQASALREKKKLLSNKEALLNPPRRPDALNTQPPGPKITSSQATTIYHQTVLRLQGLLSTLTHKTDKGSVTPDDIDTLHKEFKSFVNYHPLYSPAARRARALALAPNAPNARPQPKRTGGRKKKVAITEPPRFHDQPSAGAPHAEHHWTGSGYMPTTAPGGAGYPDQMYYSGGPDQYTMHPPHHYNPNDYNYTDYNHQSAYPNGHPGYYNPLRHSNVSTYGPHMSVPAGEMLPGTIRPGPADSAAIAYATAMGHGAGGGGGAEDRAALELLHVLSTGVGHGGGGDADELAASALMSLGTNAAAAVAAGTRRSNRGGGYKRGAAAAALEERPAPASGGRRRRTDATAAAAPPPRALPAPLPQVPAEYAPGPEVKLDESVENQLLHLLLQGISNPGNNS